MRYRLWMIGQGALAVVIVWLTLRTFVITNAAMSVPQQGGTGLPVMQKPLIAPPPPLQPTKPQLQDPAPQRDYEVPKLDPKPEPKVATPGQSLARKTYEPSCEKLDMCLMDYWAVAGRDESSTSIRFMAGRGGHKCIFHVPGEDVTVQAVEVRGLGAALLGVGLYGCDVPAGPAPAEMTLLGRRVTMPVQENKRYELTAVIMFRIFKADLFNITFMELEEWIEGMRYAGVQHVYAYDNWLSKSESQESNFARLVESGFVTYHAWPMRRFGYPLSQGSSYTHCLQRYGKESTWQFQADVDEYPLLKNDSEPGYMLRLAKSFERDRPEVSQIHLQSVFYGPREEVIPPVKSRGECLDACERRCSRPMLIERLHRRNEPYQSLRIKPLFRPGAMHEAAVHVYVGSGSTVQLPFSQAWLLHYWGFRCTDCDTKDLSALPIAAGIRQALMRRDCGL